MTSDLAGARRILGRELTEILRDHRAIIVGLVLPLALYPALLFGIQGLQKSARNKLASRGYTYAVVRDLHILHDVAAKAGRGRAVKVRAPFQALKRNDVQAVIDDRKPDAIVVYFDGSSEESQAAIDKVRDALKELVELRWKEKLQGYGMDDPRKRIATGTHDLTSGASGSQLPLYAPFILIMAVMGGASMAALDAIAGERERGTIETLLVQPVSRGSIAMGKLGAVVTMALLSTLANLIAMAVAATLFPEASLIGLDFRSGALLILLSVPLAVLLSSILLAVTSYARSYREAQGYHYPLMMLALLPGALPVLPGIKLDPVLAWIPVGNVALSISEILRDVGRPGIHLLAFAATSLYAAAALLAAVRLIESEEVLSGARIVEVHDQAMAKRGISFAFLTMLSVYYVGTLVQSWSIVPGLLLTIWGLVLGPSLLLGKISGLPFAEAFPARRPSAGAVVGAVLMPLAIAPTVLLAYRIQNYFVPAPDQLEEAFAPLLDLPAWVRVFAMGITPGICEEMLFRGVLLTLLFRGYGKWRAVILSSLLFGAFHLSPYRLMPTAIVGMALALVCLRTGSIIPSMIIHATYNTMLAFGSEAFEEQSRLWWGVPSALVLLALSWWLMRPERAAATPSRSGARDPG